MAETFVHKDGEHIRVEVEALQSRFGVERATVIWWMTQCHCQLDRAHENLKNFLQNGNYSDREHAEKIAAYYVKQRLTS